MTVVDAEVWSTRRLDERIDGSSINFAEIRKVSGSNAAGKISFRVASTLRRVSGSYINQLHVHLQASGVVTNLNDNNISRR